MEIQQLKKDFNFDKLKIDNHTLIKNITNRIYSVFKDLRYNHLSECRHLIEKCNLESNAKVSDKSK